jgi:hypothetical protein
LCSLSSAACLDDLATPAGGRVTRYGSITSGTMMVPVTTP